MYLKQTASYEYSDDFVYRVLRFQNKKEFPSLTASFLTKGKHGLKSLYFDTGKKDKNLIPERINLPTDMEKLHLLHDALGDILAEHEAFEFDSKTCRYGK
jgi:hypothetical protein